MEDKISIIPGIKGMIVKAKSKTNNYHDWLLVISHVISQLDHKGVFDNLVFCYACICIGTEGFGNDASIKPMAFGYTSHYDFYAVTEKEKNELKELFKLYGLKFIKGINRVVKR